MGRPSKPLLSVERIVDAALEIVDNEGTKALTMRRLSKSLGTQVASLYNHIADRDELLDLLVARVMSSIDMAPIEHPDLPVAVSGQAIAFLNAVAQHPNMAETIAFRPVRSTASFNYYERTVARLVEAGLAPEDALGVLFAIDDYAIGSMLNGYDNIDLGEHASAFPLLALVQSRGFSPDYRVRALGSLVHGLTSG